MLKPDKTSTSQAIKSPAPDISHQPSVDFQPEKFDILIEQRGYDVYHEKAVNCACRQTSAGAHQPLSDCLNCGGSGWMFINKTKTKMVISSMSHSNKSSEWSKEKIGMANITARSDFDKLGEMDRITVSKGLTYFTESLHIIEDTDLFCYLSYEVVKVEHLFLFLGPKEKHKLLVEGVDFTVDGNILVLNEKYRLKLTESRLSLSTRYLHRPTYHVLDLPRDNMVSDVFDVTEDKRKAIQFPIHAIGRRAHYVPDLQSISGPTLFDNSDLKPTAKNCDS